MPKYRVNRIITSVGKVSCLKEKSLGVFLWKPCPDIDTLICGIGLECVQKKENNDVLILSLDKCRVTIMKKCVFRQPNQRILLKCFYLFQPD